MIKDIKHQPASGYPMLAIFLTLALASIGGLVVSARADFVGGAIGSLVVMMGSLLMLGGLFVVNPNESRVLQLFGRYVGTVVEPGLRYANPFFTKGKVSLRVRNFETNKVKVNDSHGNPVEIAAVVVWQVVDSAEALFEVDDFSNYVHVQSESALRNLATGYPYDGHGEDVVSLSGDTAVVGQRLQEELHERLDKAGVRVLEARISHLAYAQEIAAAMLQRQQAAAVVAARTQIVEGAVGMVDMALAKLGERGIVQLDEERKAAMVSNLLVVLCSDRHTQPVVNTGTLYN
jgi:regulator of protease activity HflC (stomatin/prohibitin superfamily)